MARGVLGIILCPMLEDELLYNIGRDKDVGRIVLLDNEFCGSTRDKMTKKGLKFDVVPEADFDAGKTEFDRSIFNVVIKSNDLALHSEPQDLKAHIEKQIRDMQPYVDALGLYYGLCGNYGWDITAWCREQGLKPAAVFRDDEGKVCDDCISVALGGSKHYLALQKKYTGMFYMTPAFANNWQDFAMAGDDAKSIATLPEETREALGITDKESFIAWMFEFCGYQNTLKIDTGLGDSENFEKKFQEISARLNLKPLVIEDGWVTMNSVDGIYHACKSFFKN